jgi:hypothetical protein
MRRDFFLAVGVVAYAAIAGPLSAQTFQRKAALQGGGSPDRGRCVIEVVVDGAAEVEIRGDTGTLRNIWGQPPQWRRFECTGVIPANPPNFRFTGVEGRGSQELVRGLANGGVAMVRIQDPPGGAAGYTFELSWNSGPGYFPTPQRGQPEYPERSPSNQRDYPREGRRLTTEEAVRACREAVTDQAFQRFHTANIAFRTTNMDDNPGRQDWVVGILDVRRGYERDETYRFSCSVNFDTGEVRSAEIEPMQGGRYPFGDRDRDATNTQAIESCSRAVEDRIRRNGYQHIDFLSINTDDRPGRNDWIVGNVRADRPYRSDSFEFSCSVDMQSGVVRSIDIRRR